MQHSETEFTKFTPELVFLRQKLIFFINASCALFFLCYGIYFLHLGFYSDAGFSFSIFLLNVALLLFRKLGMSSLVQSVIAVFDLLGYVLLAILYGHLSGGYLMIILWIICTAYLYKSHIYGIPLIAAGILSYIFTEYHSWHNPPIIAPEDIGVLHSVVMAYCLVYLVVLVRMIRKHNRLFGYSMKKKNLALRKYYTAIEQSSVAIMITDTLGNIEYVNPQLEKVSGYKREDVLGRNANMFKSGGTERETYDALWRTIKRGKTWTGEFFNAKPSGKQYIEKACISPVTDEDGTIVSYIAVKEDVTVLKRMQDKLVEREKKFRFITEHTTDFIWKFDLTYFRYTYVSPSVEYLRGYKPEELLGKSIRVSLTEDSYLKILEDINDAIADEETGKSDGIFCNRYKQLNKNGETAYIELTGAFIRDENGRAVEMLGTSRNITDRVKMEKEILQKNEELKQILSTTQEQKLVIERINKELVDSINYAKTIQKALFPSSETIMECFSEHFLMFYPKTTVSGDFYYVKKIHGKLIFTVGDCTGHGVPGGFMTILAINYLHAIIKRNDYDSSAHVLEILRKKIKSTFSRGGARNKDGFDIALCIFDEDARTLTYSGAYNPAWLIRNGELIEYPATKNPVGFHYEEIPFADVVIPVQENDSIYLFTDGFYDQFGGALDKRYTKKRFKNDLLEICNLPMNEQKKILKSRLFKWMHHSEQTDDITLMGIKWKGN